MTHHAKNSATKAIDRVQQRLTDYACSLEYEGISSSAVHAAKVRIIDTLGALLGGFFSEPARLARNLAAQTPGPNGSSVIGTRMKTTPDMAAFVNGTTARFSEMSDIYDCPGGVGGHPSDVLMPVLGVAEHVKASGREFITSVVLAYEVYLRISDGFHNTGWDHTNFSCAGTAVASGKLLGLNPVQMSHCIAMAVVPNNMLRQARTNHLTMFKSTATGHAGRAGVFAALLARAGMEGPHLPYEGKAGWMDHVACDRYTLDAMGGGAIPFKILETLLKNRPVASGAITAILAAEKLAPLRNLKDVKQVTVEVYKRAKEVLGTGEHFWNPDSGDTADHSIPYCVAAALLDGTVTPRSFDDAHLHNPHLHALLQKIEVVENPQFTKEFKQRPHLARVTVVAHQGERLVGEAGGNQDGLSTQKPQSDIEEKFRVVSEDCLGAKQVRSILERLWRLEDMEDVATIPSAFIFA